MHYTHYALQANNYTLNISHTHTHKIHTTHITHFELNTNLTNHLYTYKQYILKGTATQLQVHTTHECVVQSVQCVVISVQCVVSSCHCVVCSVQLLVCCVLCVQFVVCSVQCVVICVQCVMCVQCDSVQCVVNTLHTTHASACV